MVLEGYIDDSGIGEGKAAVLAGFLSTAEQWKLFSDSLESLCEQEPKTPDFKMVKATDFRTYYPATRQSLDKRIQDVATLIQKHATYRVDAVVDREAYEFFVKGRVPKEIDSPYFILFYNIILSTAKFMDKAKLEGTADFVFDEQGKVGTRTRDWYYFIKERVSLEIRRRLGGEPTFKHDTELLPLKAADLLAWQIRRHLALEQPGGLEHNEIIDTIVGQILGVSCQIRPEDLRDFVASIGHGLLLKSDCQYHIPKEPPPQKGA